jgi:uncharacterized membrane protein YhaH (DUF805 family)
MPRADAADVPLNQPLTNATMEQATARFWRKYASFSGRASRSEYWYALLVALLPLFILEFFVPAILPAMPEPVDRIGTAVLIAVGLAYTLALIIPLLAVTWRRLHDSNSSGGLLFFGLIPLIGPILLLANLVGASDPDGARFDTPTDSDESDASE